METPPTHSEQKGDEAILAAAAAESATAAAREASMEAIIQRAFTKMFAAKDQQGGNRFIDVSRVPLICQAIIGINDRLNSIEQNLTWGVRVVIGAVILAIIALILKK